ncbi:MAG: hypothetical protein AAF471_07645, partial [Myxococcota bacterium]
MGRHSPQGTHHANSPTLAAKKTPRIHERTSSHTTTQANTFPAKIEPISSPTDHPLRRRLPPHQGAAPAALESPDARLDESRKYIDRLLRKHGRYVRDAKQTTRDVLIPQNSQWESLLPLLHKFLGWHVIDIQEKSGGKHDDETQEASEKLTA